ncbi:MAG: hypothetical protein Q7O66_09840, partial [Dehalococcoidia bacterium]|nr:hypothetical protein [Dehalococcoidia bacterium]
GMANPSFGAVGGNVNSVSEPGANVVLSRAPDLVAPAVGWLVHDTCSLTGETLYAAAGFVGRVFVGITPGYFNPDLSIESVRDNWPEISEENGYAVIPNSQTFRTVIEKRAGTTFGNS